MSSPPTEESAVEPAAIVPKSATDENLKTELTKENDAASKTSLPNDSHPKVSNETRHSIGSYVVPIKDHFPRTSASLGIGGGRSNRPSQSDNTLAKSQSEIQVCATNSLSVSQNISNVKDTTDFRQMEQGLLQLLEDFHCGKLEGFGSNCTFEKMENVREQQEKLARLHFDLNAQQELCGQHTDEGINMAKGNLSKLMENLQQLSQSIEQLQSGSPERDWQPSGVMVVNSWFAICFKLANFSFLDASLKNETSKMALNIAIDEDYGYVIIVGILSMLFGYGLGANVFFARKRFGIKYPIMYSETNLQFNCMQRVHANYLEMFPTYLVLLFCGGLAHPFYCAIAGIIYLLGRMVYSIGYSTGGKI
ncbi:coiled-coil domain-containing protein 28B [Trichonephila inaurata madagascariensis]|uniref:Coiled-coil domain-containing protein 28B n=1 Tax=Trichonephila inaurata madagascariensis TaxID=2747483 RepID=A0A8X6XQF5_9ARAC|nr:coiled-coil domain-containing protein 28B [Trichonephila inaurata madagascariensis]